MANTHPSIPTRTAVGHPRHLDIAELDAAVHKYCLLGLAPSTQRTYRAAINRFSVFCTRYNVSQPFPVNELLLCRFVAELAREGLAPGTIKTYLAGIRHAQIIRGLPEPTQAARMPRLKLLQSGVARDRSLHQVSLARQRLPITPAILNGMRQVWSVATGTLSHDLVMLRAAATLCLFGFFR